MKLHSFQKVYIVLEETNTMLKLNKKVEEQVAVLKTIYWFFAYPAREMSLSDLSVQIGISKTTANRVVNLLEKEKFLKKEVLGKIWRISCNQKHEYNTTMKISYNLGLIYESKIINRIYKKVPSCKAIILFGSYRKGDDTEESDVDIAVEILGDKTIEIISLGSIDVGHRKNVPVNLHLFSRNKIDLNLFANIANGFILDGFLEVRP